MSGVATPTAGFRIESDQSSDQTDESLSSVLDRLFTATYMPLGGALGLPIEVRSLCAPFTESIARLQAKLEQPDRKATVATLRSARAAWQRHKPSIHAV